MFYLEETYEQVDKKMTKFDSFPEEIKVVLDKYINAFYTKLRKSINVERGRLNVREGSKLRVCYSCRLTLAHYSGIAQKLDHHIVKYCGDSRSEWCAPAHFVKKPGRVP